MAEITAPPLSIGRSGVHLPDDATLRELAATFARDGAVLLPRFVAPDLLALVQSHLRSAPFRTRVATRVYPPAVDLKLADERMHGLLHFLLNEPAVIECARRIARTPDATGYVGAVYRLIPEQGHHDSWHDDWDGNRLVALTINLSEHAFRGGELEMRDRRSERVLLKVANTGPGDALLFALGQHLQHRVSPIQGTAPKTALAGWFCRDADLKVA